MMKYKNKEYPVSVFKVHVHDIVLDRLDWIKEKIEVNNNVEAFTACVNAIYNQLSVLDEYNKTGEVPENDQILDEKVDKCDPIPHDKTTILTDLEDSSDV